MCSVKITARGTPITYPSRIGDPNHRPHFFVRVDLPDGRTILVRAFPGQGEQIRGIGGKVVQSKTAGQDVSEEYLDLEARLRAKKALEAQFLEIMKQAHKVSDVLDVQNELANVRTEIERLEGRRRFLENQSALSTITINLQLPAPVVATTSTSFGQEIKQAFGAAIDIAAGIVLLIIRAVIVLLPFGLIFGVPSWFLWRFLRRRYRVNAEVPRITES